MSGEELALFITAAALSAAQCLKTEELEILAVVFTQLADTLATLAVVRSLNQEISEDGTEIPLSE